MVWVASGIQTARIRHGDKGSLCRWMSNALTDESETRLSLSLYSLAHLALFFLHLFPTSFSPSLSLLSLSFRGCKSIVSLYPPFPSGYCLPSFPFCQMFFHSTFKPIFIFLSLFTQLLSSSVSIHVCTYSIYLNSNSLYWHEQNCQMTPFKFYTVTQVDTDITILHGILRKEKQIGANYSKLYKTIFTTECNVVSEL